MVSYKKWNTFQTIQEKNDSIQISTWNRITGATRSERLHLFCGRFCFYRSQAFYRFHITVSLNSKKRNDLEKTDSAVPFAPLGVRTSNQVKDQRNLTQGRELKYLKQFLIIIKTRSIEYKYLSQLQMLKKLTFRKTHI